MTTLHLYRRNKHETMDTKSSNLYSLTRNSFNRTTFAGHSKVSSHKTHTKSGQVTLLGLKKGYIQASPNYPETKLALEWNADKKCIVISGYTKDGKNVFNTYSKLTSARIALRSIK
jgi:hypothetical protein